VKGNSPEVIYESLVGKVSYATIYRWKKHFDSFGDFSVKTPPGRPKSVRTPENCLIVSTCLAKRMSAKQTTSKKFKKVFAKGNFNIFLFEDCLSKQAPRFL